jgi:site-specific recombinase XerD
MARCLEAYLPLRHNLLERRGAVKEPALLINREGKRLSAQSLSLLVHRLARKAKVPLVTLHQFRHTCASDLLEHGASVSEVQNILGHKSAESTWRYLHIGDPERTRAMSKHPLNGYLPALLAKEQGTQP